MQGEISNAEERSSATILVRGRVQGVYFRKFTVENARKLGLTGFAQNMPDGSVKVFAEGEKSSIQELIVFLHTGPAQARVDGLEISWSSFASEFQDFSIKR
ncbi:acylphosphatase [Methanolobus mangrovi]|uniref:Acylphosphatase n=1 Tax=Methanolobus mangrovi TaxID=3072977 RepID=A0AA51UFH9_9EURY|nr:acylphosphatase [Methanolobus mangrovi]WMW22230.1 acylphosphatase [Methanolobus mangrovi]